jgi:putative ATPase
MRRLTRFASEDVGMADPQALIFTLAAWQSYDRLGSPEGELAMMQAVIYLASAPKSNAAYVAEKSAKAAARATGSLPPPKHMLNAPTALMKQQGYGKGYIYEPDTDSGFAGQNGFPDQLPRQNFYNPRGVGFEAEILERLRAWAALRPS